LRLFSFVGYGLALAALALEVFGAYDSYPNPKQMIILNDGKIASFIREERYSGESLPCVDYP